MLIHNSKMNIHIDDLVRYNRSINSSVYVPCVAIMATTLYNYNSFEERTHIDVSDLQMSSRDLVT